MTDYEKNDVKILVTGAVGLIALALLVRGCYVSRSADVSRRIQACVNGRQWEACLDCSRIETRSADVCRQIVAQLSQDRSKEAGK